MSNNPYNDQLVVCVCAECGEQYIGHPTSRYCSEPHRSKGHRKNRRSNRSNTGVPMEQYRATLINPTPEQFLLTLEIHSKGHNPKPTRIYALSDNLASVRLPSNVDLLYIPPDPVVNTEGVPYWVMITEAPTPSVSAPKRTNALDVLNKHLK